MNFEKRQWSKEFVKFFLHLMANDWLNSTKLHLKVLPDGELQYQGYARHSDAVRPWLLARRSLRTRITAPSPR